MKNRYTAKEVMIDMVNWMATLNPQLLPTPKQLLKGYKTALKKELNHWNYQKKCWEDGSYGSHDRVKGAKGCEAKAKRIAKILERIES